jgi:hypothetical protein
MTALDPPTVPACLETAGNFTQTREVLAAAVNGGTACGSLTVTTLVTATCTTCKNDGINGTDECDGNVLPADKPATDGWRCVNCKLVRDCQKTTLVPDTVPSCSATPGYVTQVWQTKGPDGGGAPCTELTKTTYVGQCTLPTPVITWNDPAAIVYGTELSSIQLNATATVNGTTVIGDFLYSPPAGTILDVGDTNVLSVTFRGQGGYPEVTKTVNQKVTQKGLECTPVAASRLYKAANPALAYSCTGFITKSGVLEGTTVFTKAGSLTTTAVFASNAGTYDINWGDFPEAKNYSISRKPGTNLFTVSKRSVSCAAHNKSLTAGATFDPTTFLTATCDGFVDNEIAQVVLSNGSLTTTATSPAVTGNYPISYSTNPKPSATNYNVTTSNATLSVSDKTVLRCTIGGGGTFSYGATVKVTGNPVMDGSTQVNGGFSYEVAPGVNGIRQTFPADGFKLGAGTYTMYARFKPSVQTYAEINCDPLSVTVTKAARGCSPGTLAPITYGNSLTLAQQQAVASFNPNDEQIFYSISGGALAAPLTDLTTIVDRKLNASNSAYTITASVPETNNYSASSCSTTLMVNSKDLNCAPHAKSMYQGSDPSKIPLTHSCTTSDFVAPDSMAQVSGGALETNATASSPVGSNYYIRYVAGSPPSIPNYTVKTTESKLTVNMKLASSCTVSIDPASPVLSSYIYPRGEGKDGNGFTMAGSFSYSYTGGGQASVPINGSFQVNAAGNYTVAATFTPANKNYDTATCSASFTIAKVTPTCAWAQPQAITYGTKLSVDQLNAVATYNGATVAGIFSYSPASATTPDANDALEITATFTPSTASAGNFNTCSLKRTLKVNKAPLSCRADDKRKFAGQPNPALTYSCNGFVNGDTQSKVPITLVVVTGPSGSYITASPAPTNSNYLITWTDGVLKIDPQITPACTVTVTNPSLTYGDAIGTPTTTALGGVEASTISYSIASAELSSETFSATKNYDAGTYTITAKFAPKETDQYLPTTCTTQVTIAKRDYQCSFTSPPPASIEYGTPVNLQATASATGGDTYNSTSNSTRFVFNPGASSTLRPGSYKLQVNFTPPSAVQKNFNGCTTTKDLTVSKTYVTCRPNNKTKVYGTANPPLDFTCRAGENKSDNIDKAIIPANIFGGKLETTVGNNTVPGTIIGSITWDKVPWSDVYEVQTSLDGNAQEKGIFTITKAPLRCKADNRVIQATKTAKVPVSYTYGCGGFVGADTMSSSAPSGITLKAYKTVNNIEQEIADADVQTANKTYTIKNQTGLAISSTNYDVTLDSGELKTVAVSPSSCTLEANPTVYTYGDTITVGTPSGYNINASSFINGTFSYQISSNGSTNTVYDGNYPPTLNAGSHVFTATFKPSNSNVAESTCSAAITVKPKAVTCSWTAPSAINYPSALTGTQLNAKATSSPAPAGSFTYDPPAGTVLVASTVAHLLKATFIPSNGNFTGCPTSTTITVNKIPVTTTAGIECKPNRVSRQYGSANPTLSYRCYDRSNPSVTITDSITGGTLTTTADNLSNVGKYPITLTGVTSTIYDIAIVPGELEVTQAPLSCKADSKSKFKGAANPTLTGSCSGILNSNNPTISYTRAAGEDVGKYDITPSVTASNYAVTVTKGTLEIKALPQADCGIEIVGGGASRNFGSGNVITARATVSSSGFPVTGGTVTFSYKKDGSATAQAMGVGGNTTGVVDSSATTLEAGTYDITATFSGTSSTSGAVCSAPLTIGKGTPTCAWTLSPTSLKVDETVPASVLGATVKDNLTALTSPAMVYQRTVGAVTESLSAGSTFSAAGIYNLKMSWAGNANWNGCEVTRALTVNTKQGDNCSVTNKTITWPTAVTIDGSGGTFPSTAPDGRQYSYDLSSLLLTPGSGVPRPGSYTIKATLPANDRLSLTTSTDGTLTVNKAKGACVLATPQTITLPNTVKIQDSAGANYLLTDSASGRNFTYVASIGSSKTTLSNGSTLAANDYDVDATLAGDEFYEPTTCSGKLKVVPQPVTGPFCGDGQINQDSEECDGGIDSGCAGLGCSCVACKYSCPDSAKGQCLTTVWFGPYPTDKDGWPLCTGGTRTQTLYSAWSEEVGIIQVPSNATGLWSFNQPGYFGGLVDINVGPSGRCCPKRGRRQRQVTNSCGKSVNVNMGSECPGSPKDFTFCHADTGMEAFTFPTTMFSGNGVNLGGTTSTEQVWPRCP